MSCHVSFPVWYGGSPVNILESVEEWGSAFGHLLVSERKYMTVFVPELYTCSLPHETFIGNSTAHSYAPQNGIPLFVLSQVIVDKQIFQKTRFDMKQRESDHTEIIELSIKGGHWIFNKN
jgi:hypothetical protein